MTEPATFAPSLGSEFNAFLYAPIGQDPDVMPLSVLSAFTRLGMDPWSEAAELSSLSRELAIQRLAKLVERLPEAYRTGTDCRAIAERLAALLPGRKTLRSSIARGTGPRVGKGVRLTIPRLILAIAALLVAMALFRGGISFDRDHLDERPVNFGSPPQTTIYDR